MYLLLMVFIIISVEISVYGFWKENIPALKHRAQALRRANTIACNRPNDSRNVNVNFHIFSTRVIRVSSMCLT